MSSYATNLVASTRAGLRPDRRSYPLRYGRLTLDFQVAYMSRWKRLGV